MKKYLVLLLAVVLVGVLAACGSAADKEQAELPPQQDQTGAASIPQEKRILIAYFTRADNTVVQNASVINADAASSASLLAPGNTQQMAALIQEKVGGDLFSIRVKEPYPENYEACLERAADETAAGARPELVEQLEHFQDYDIIFLGYPNWSYNCPMAVLTFLESYDFKGKTIIPFVSHGTGGLAASLKVLERTVPEAKILMPLGIYRDDMPQAAAKIAAWLEQLQY